MLVNICTVLSLIVFAVTFIFMIVSAFLGQHRRRKIKSYHLLIAGASVSAFFLFLPFYEPQFVNSSAPTLGSWLLAILASLHHTIRLFVVDADFEIVHEVTQNAEPLMRGMYRTLSAVLFVLCPALTAGGILSFFENITAYRRYITHFFSDTYIFSDLNDRSIKLARSLKNNDPKRTVVFTDVFKTNEESSYELIKQAQELDAVLFKNDITVVNFRWHSKKTKLYFFVIGDDETENINQTIALCYPPRAKKKNAENAETSEQPHVNSYEFPDSSEYKFNGYDAPRSGDTRVFLFTTQASSEQQLSAVNPTHLKLRRVNDVQSLIFRLLHDEGHEIFRSAVPSGNMITSPFTGEPVEEKLISAVIIGLGHHGTEMLKGLSWFCQLYPYRLEVTAFEKDKYAESHFRSQCPELMADGYNHDFTTDGEAHYSIRINPSIKGDNKSVGYDVHSSEFDRAIESIGKITYVLVALGNDDLNVQVAAKIRVLLKRKGLSPFIHAIVYNPDKQELLQNGTNYAGMMYDISPTGNIASNYSEECILNSDIEEKAMERHLAWVEKTSKQQNWPAEKYAEERREAENAFWKYDYNYRSSVASAIHAKFKKGFQVIKYEKNVPYVEYEQPGVLGTDRAPADRTPEELVYLRKMEHQRWNAYVRSEGFVYAEQRDKLAKTHNLLVPFDKLPLDEQEKDDD